MKIEHKTLIARPEPAYALIDSGDNMKLERYGAYMLARPDPQALWKQLRESTHWLEADARFVSSWKSRKDMPAAWNIKYNGLTFEVRLAAFKHTGIFPEHAPSWDFMREKINQAKRERVAGEPIKVLNLFGYTGGATLACAQVGAEVVHVDASKPSVDAAVKNAELSNLHNASIRWIVDDAHVFVKRELRRGNKYDAIVMDPPSFGRGPKGEVWKIEDHLIPLLEDCMKLMSSTPLFFILNGYAAGYAPEAYLQILQSVLLTPDVDLSSMHETIQYGGLLIEEEGTSRVLPAGVYARIVY